MIEVFAPGRICLFGDHQDYLGMPVIACAIDKGIILKAKKNVDSLFRISLPDINQERKISLKSDFVSNSNIDYYLKALEVLNKLDCNFDCGYDIIIKGNLPINAGLSSSSAIVVAWIRFLLKTFGNHLKITSEFIAKLSYRIEVLEYNSPGGLMDQYTISIGNLLYLNTVNGNHEIISKPNFSLIIGESGVPKETNSVLKSLRGFAEKAISTIQSKYPDFKIEESEIEDFEKYNDLLSDELKPIFYAAIKNYTITKEAYNELNKTEVDIQRIGQLMNEHHNELKDNLKITVPIIDKMINGAIKNGAFGAKIVGSGGGGCIVAISTQESESKIIQGIIDSGAKKAYKVTISNGVFIIE
jgi:galactokinase